MGYKRPIRTKKKYVGKDPSEKALSKLANNFRPK
jgi:hypothetical protein